MDADISCFFACGFEEYIHCTCSIDCNSLYKTEYFVPHLLSCNTLYYQLNLRVAGTKRPAIYRIIVKDLDVINKYDSKKARFDFNCSCEDGRYCYRNLIFQCQKCSTTFNNTVGLFYHLSNHYLQNPPSPLSVCFQIEPTL